MERGQIMKPQVDKKDQFLMQLAHYFITVENYSPIIVNGVKNEIWLENIEAPYRIIRINANYLHNNEQMAHDIFKIKNIVKQVKKKTLSFSVKTLNILLDVGSTVNVMNDKKIDSIFIDVNEKITKNKEINNLYPELRNNLVEAQDSIEFVINVTNDINNKTAKDNDEYERIFRKKKNVITYLFIAINMLVFLIGTMLKATGTFDLFAYMAVNKALVKSGEIYRLITCAFAHESILHLLVNMYSLYIIGGQVESFIGKKKYTLIYLFSAIIGGMLSCIVNGDYGFSLGASGAIFGLMGTLLYFGYHYRLYLDNALKTQIIPIIVFNLLIGFTNPLIDNSAHIGGLVGGLFSSMAMGVENHSPKSDKINGVVCSIILIGFLSFLLFFMN